LGFDTIFFLGFGCLCLYLGLSGSKWLFWGATKHERLERQIGAEYRKVVNISCGLISLAFGFYFLLA
jgi:hypothetical protein